MCFDWSSGVCCCCCFLVLIHMDTIWSRTLQDTHINKSININLIGGQHVSVVFTACFYCSQLAVNAALNVMTTDVFIIFSPWHLLPSSYLSMMLWPHALKTSIISIIASSIIAYLTGSPDDQKHITQWKYYTTSKRDATNALILHMMFLD